MHFLVPSIACPNLTLLYINYTTNGFVLVVPKMIFGVMLPERKSSLRKSFLVESIFYFQAYILALRVHFSRVKLNRTQKFRQAGIQTFRRADRFTFFPLANSRWSNNRNIIHITLSEKDILIYL